MTRKPTAFVVKDPDNIDLRSLGPCQQEATRIIQGWPLVVTTTLSILREGNYSHFYGQLIAKAAAALKSRDIILELSYVMRELLD